VKKIPIDLRRVRSVCSDDAVVCRVAQDVKGTLTANGQVRGAQVRDRAGGRQRDREGLHGRRRRAVGPQAVGLRRAQIPNASKRWRARTAWFALVVKLNPTRR
jgi:hypothetical protein